MTRKQIAKAYISYLENGEIENVIHLFTTTGIVHSPIYGTKPARAFYTILAKDTSNSKLKTNGIFEDQDSNQLALYFNYTWTLKNDTIVSFDVVDIIYFNEENKITELKIIYDTQLSRIAVDSLLQD